MGGYVKQLHLSIIPIRMAGFAFIMRLAQLIQVVLGEVLEIRCLPLR